ncbi:MAG: polysaccharide biosynthesis C-terminal domain-containing protein [Chitinophagales bacterium]|nr:polysaccharide biosynthesis C-terminal domain-containing protein [Chitinophagales bacterium]MDW8428170.1 polysaccharide biosynthesis C-terminal domain-containing protein [Chitinophagales bacterium]
MIKKILNQLLARHNRAVGTVLILQVTSLLLSLAITLLISNLWGPVGYGVYAYAFSWALLLGNYAGLGMDQASLRLIPEYLTRQELHYVRGFLKIAQRFVLIASLLLLVCAFCFSLILDFPTQTEVRNGMWLGLLSVPVITLINLRAAWLRSLQQPVWSQLPDKLVRPALLLVFLLTAWAIGAAAISPEHLVVFALISTGIALVLAVWRSSLLISKAIPPVAPSFKTSAWLRLGLSLLLISGAYYLLAQMPLLLLGIFHDARETGLFAVAYRLSDIEGYVLYALNVVLAPTISHLYTSGERQQLQRTVTAALWAGFILAAPLMAVCLLAPHWVLHFFGNAFPEAAPVLVVLTLGQLVTFVMGPVGYLLTMTGHQRVALWILAAAAVLSLVLGLAWIPAHGARGAAWAVAATSALLSVSMALAVRKYTGINATLFAWANP